MEKSRPLFVIFATTALDGAGIVICLFLGMYDGV
jgi:hypothetical protein